MGSVKLDAGMNWAFTVRGFVAGEGGEAPDAGAAPAPGGGGAGRGGAPTPGEARQLARPRP